MARGSGKGSGEDDDQLWESYTRDIAPIDKKRVRKIESPPLKAVLKKARQEPPPAHPKISKATQPPQLDARTEQRLRRGQIEIDGKLDLHGMTQAQAHERLKIYVAHAAARDKRCLLIITGKGRGEGTGVIKQKFPQWMAEPDIRDMVLKIVPAAIKDGGSGAWYVYLKRRRDY